MPLIYNKNASTILEYLFALQHVQTESDKKFAELSLRQKKIFADIAEVHNHLRQELEEYLPLIREIGFSDSSSLDYPIVIYFYLLKHGYNPSNMEEYIRLVQEMSTLELKESLAWMLTLSSDSSENLLTVLEDVDLSAEDKWYCYQAITHPEEVRDKIVRVLKEFYKVYTSYYQSVQEELAAFREKITEEKVLQLFRDNSSLLDDLESKDCQLVLLSPYITTLMAITLADDEKELNEKALQLVIVSCRMDQFLLERDALDIDSLTTILKTIGDASRYQVLIELTKPHMKKKDIAEKLGITSAAVTFHTQKLLNAQILTIQKDDKGVKYKVNQELLTEITAKLLEDFSQQD